MLQLADTNDKLELGRSSTANIDVVASYVDHTTSSDDVVGSKQLSTFSTAATGDIVSSPGSGVIRRIKLINIWNRHATTSCTVTAYYNDNGTQYTLYAVTLQAGEGLIYIEGVGWFVNRAISSAGISYVKLTSDLSSATVTTMADATGLTLAVLNGQYYRFRFLVLAQTAATTTGVKLSVTIPTVTRFAATVTGLVSTAADGTANIFFGHITSSDDAVTATGIPAATTDHLHIVEGVIVPSADGNVQLRMASEVAASGITVRQGSMGELVRLP